MAEDSMYFAVKTIGMSTYGGRKPQNLLDAARHNLREIQAEHGANGHIDPLRIGHNVLMRGPPKAAEVVNQASELYAVAGVEPSKLRKDHCQAIELVFSLPVESAIHGADYFERCLRWTGEEYRLPILLATAHHDEGAKHLHVLLLPLLNALYVGGKPVCKAATKEKRESFFLKVAGSFGLKRSNAKMRGTVKAWGVQAVMARVQAEGLNACMNALWPVLQAAIERDPLPAMNALKIDVNSIRPQPAPPEEMQPSKAIGFAGPVEKPIGFQPKLISDKNLSGVGFTDQKALRGLKATPCGTVQGFERGLLAAGCSPMDASTSSPTSMKEEDGIVRDREGFCQVPDAWMD